MSALLHVDRVNKRFGAVVAAADITLTVQRGECVSLIGSNGAGKTMLVNMVTGYLKPDDGRIGFDGQDVTALAPRAITRLGVACLFQIPQLYGDLTVLDNMFVANACHDQRLSFWQPAQRPEATGSRRAPARALSLGEHRGRRVAELLGAARKLVDIAMALPGAPRLLVLDEPTSGVSAEEKFPVMDTIMSALGHEATTVLFVEHDMEIVERRRVVAFYAGRVIADGAPGARCRRRAPLRHRRVARGVGGGDAFEVRSLHVAIDSVVALRGLSLEVGGGRMVGLVGRNGAGKTTLMRTLMGHLAPASGSVVFDGRDLLALPAHARAGLGIGYMPEDRGLVPELTVEENILVPLWVNRALVTEDRLALVYRVLPELVEMRGRRALLLLGRPAEARRAGARARRRHARLLLLDELPECVAPALSKRLADVIASLKGRGLGADGAERPQPRAWPGRQRVRDRARRQRRSGGGVSRDAMCASAAKRHAEASR